MADTAELTPAIAEPVDDTSLQFRIGEIGNQIHNIACEHQDDDELCERLGELRGRLWSITSQMAQPAPMTVEAAAQVLMDQPYDVMRKAFDAMDKMQGEGADNIMASALRALAAKGGQP